MQPGRSLAIVLTVFVLCLQAVPARAQSTRTFVSGTGSDASATCGRAAPCRTFAGAITKTDAGGEIIVLDAAAVLQSYADNYIDGNTDDGGLPPTIATR